MAVCFNTRLLLGLHDVHLMESVPPLLCTPTTILTHITLQLFVVDLEP